MKIKISILTLFLFSMLWFHAPLGLAQSSAQSSSSIASISSSSSSSSSDQAGEVISESTGDEWQKYTESLGNAKGAGLLVIVLLVVQGLLLLLRSKLGEYAGKLKLLLVMFFTMVGGVLTLKLSGLDWGAVLIHSGTLVAVQVFLHQIYKQFLEKTG